MSLFHDKGAPLFRIRINGIGRPPLPLDAVAEHTMRQITTPVSELLQLQTRKS